MKLVRSNKSDTKLGRVFFVCTAYQDKAVRSVSGRGSGVSGCSYLKKCTKSHNDELWDGSIHEEVEIQYRELTEDAFTSPALFIILSNAFIVLSRW